MEALATVPLLIIDDLGMRKLPPTAAEELLEIVMRRYERTQYATDIDSAGRRLGKTTRRQRCCYRDAGPAAPSRPHPQMRPSELED